MRTSNAGRISAAFLFGLAALGILNAQGAGREETEVIAPEVNETCFSPDEPCALKLKAFIESATSSLDIAIYDINEDQIVHAILVQSKKIPVRVIVDKRQSKGRHSSVSLLRKAGVQVRFGYQRGIMHNKFTLIDGSRIEIGSFNYTNHASTANQENQVYLATPAIVERYKARFEKMWATATDQQRAET